MSGITNESLEKEFQKVNFNIYQILFLNMNNATNWKKRLMSKKTSSIIMKCQLLQCVVDRNENNTQETLGSTVAYLRQDS